MKKNGVWLVLALAAVSLKAAGVEAVFREDFTGGRLADGGRLSGEAKIVDCVFGKALKVPGKAGSFAETADAAAAWLDMLDVNALDYDPAWVRWQLIDWTLKLMKEAK